MAVSLCHGNRCMAQMLLDSLQRSSPHNKITGACVPEIVEMKILNSRSFECRMKGSLNVPEQRAIGVGKCNVFLFFILAFCPGDWAIEDVLTLSLGDQAPTRPE